MHRACTPFLLLALAACGSNRPEIPPELLAPVEGGTGNYPAGPYGGQEGDIAENFTFPLIWDNPTAQGYDPEALGPVSLADFYNPDGSGGGELLLLNAGAVWCGPCKVEHGGSATEPSLNDRFDALQPKGLRILAVLLENAKVETATIADLTAWTQAYETRFPMGLDGDFQMKRYGSRDAVPINVVIDLRTMKVLQRITGDPAAIWPSVEAELDARAN